MPMKVAKCDQENVSPAVWRVTSRRHTARQQTSTCLHLSTHSGLEDTGTAETFDNRNISININNNNTASPSLQYHHHKPDTLLTNNGLHLWVPTLLCPMHPLYHPRMHFSLPKLSDSKKYMYSKLEALGQCIPPPPKQSFVHWPIANRP